MCLDFSDARNSIALVTSSGSIHGIGIACIDWKPLLDLVRELERTLGRLTARPPTEEDVVRVVVDHVGVASRWCHGVDRDAQFCNLHRKRAREADDARLGGDVVDDVGKTGFAGHRRGRHDPPITAFGHVRENSPARLEDPGQADVDDVIPHRIVHVDDLAQRHHAGVGQQDVDLAQLVDALRDGCVHPLGVTRIGHRHRASATEPLDHRLGLLEIGLGCQLVRHCCDRCGNVGDDDVCALPSERDRMRAALSSRPSRDHHDPTVELSHRCPSFLIAASESHLVWQPVAAVSSRPLSSRVNLTVWQPVARMDE